MRLGPDRVVHTDHAGYGAITSSFSTGKALLLLLALLVGSGVLWRLIYAVVPAAAAKSVGNYSAAASRARAARSPS